MRFLIDAQLPPALADHLTQMGHMAEHVYACGLGVATDRQIWNYATSNTAVLITKDEDFAELARREDSKVAVIWIRLGNTTNKALWRALQPLMPEILEGLERRERLIEIA